MSARPIFSLVLFWLVFPCYSVPAANPPGASSSGPMRAASGRMKSHASDAFAARPGSFAAGPATTSHQGSVVQPPLSPTLVEALKRDNSDSAKGRLQIGLGRVFEKPITINRDSVAAAEWTLMADGRRVWSVEVTSQGALGLRLHLESLALPPGARILVYDPASPTAPVAAVTAKELAGESELWTQTIFAERVVVECQVSHEVDLQAVSFSVTGLSHLYALPFPKATPQAAPCLNDVSCYPEWAQPAAGVARIEFVDGGNTYLCTGCLLNHNDSAAIIDYFLTANHCIDNQKVASTLNLYWFYQTRTCNGTPPDIGSVPRTGGGADFLTGSTSSDFAFMRLRQPPPGGVYYLGWTTTSPTASETLVTIHHPGAFDDYKRISFGNEVSQYGGLWKVEWFSGVTQPGSSGAPLLNAHHQVIGQLYGGSSSCLTPTGIDEFGRFDLTYIDIKQWIDPVVSNVVAVPQGSYAGLFQAAGGVSPESSGCFNINTGSAGRLTGRLVIGGKRYGMIGQFGAGGNAQATILRRLAPDLTVNFNIDPADTDRVTGTVTDGDWTAELSGDRAVFDSTSNVPLEAGRYTLVVPGSPGSATEPGGDSYGTVLVDNGGRIHFTGSLADGTRVSQSAALSKDGRWPLCVPLYGGEGLLFSWLTIDRSAGQQPSGELTWIKPGNPNAKLYPQGFTIEKAISGSVYNGPPPLSFADAEVVLSGGGLASPIVNQISLDANGRVTNLSSNKLTLSFSPTTGAFTGRVVDPETSRAVAFKGAVLQQENSGAGFFQGAGSSGKVSVQAP